jgi:hypothetical protein
MLFLALSVAAFCGPAKATGNPLQREYKISLDRISIAGDLRLAIPLIGLHLSRTTLLEICLDHTMEDLDYQVARSRFAIVPSITYLELRGDSFTWHMPNGREIQFDNDMRSGTEANKEYRHGGMFIAGTEFTSGTYVLHIDSVGTISIRSEDRWLLTYLKGCLVRIRIPSGREFEVDGQHNRINSISANGANVVDINYDNEGNPIAVEAGAQRITCAYDDCERLTLCRDATGATLLECAYNAEGLLNAITNPSVRRARFEWKTNPAYCRSDAGYSLPFSLSAVNDDVYNISRKDRAIDLNTRNHYGERSSLHIIYDGDTVLSVSLARDGTVTR